MGWREVGVVLKGQQGLPRWSRGYTTFPMQRARGTGWGTKTPHAAQCGQKKKRVGATGKILVGIKLFCTSTNLHVMKFHKNYMHTNIHMRIDLKC